MSAISELRFVRGCSACLARDRREPPRHAHGARAWSSDSRIAVQPPPPRRAVVDARSCGPPASQARGREPPPSARSGGGQIKIMVWRISEDYCSLDKLLMDY